MWANAQRDGRPAEYSWRPLFNTAKFGERPLLECRAVTLPKREIRCNLQGCLKLANRSQPLVGRSSAHCEDIWRRHCCLFNNFFSDCRYMPQLRRYSPKSCAMVPSWRIFGDFQVLHFQGAACSTFQICILNSHQGHIMCRSMVDIQFATADIRRGKKERRRKKKQDQNIMSASATQGGHKKCQ